MPLMVKSTKHLTFLPSFLKIVVYSGHYEVDTVSQIPIVIYNCS